MSTIRSLGLSALLAWGIPAAADAQCPGAGARRFRIELDWERAALSGAAEKGSPLFRASGPPRRAAMPDCLVVAALDPSPRLPAPAGSLAARVGRSDPAAAPAGEVPSWLRPFSFFVSVAGAYDSNIENDEEPVPSYGAVVGAGARFETDAFEAEYEIAGHSYTNTDRWDRVSHSLKTSLEQDITRRLSMEAVGEVALKGSSEDRERGDEYVLEPRIHYRISPSNRLRLYGAHRLRRQNENPLRDATNQYLGAEIRQRLGAGYLDFGYRWETNRAEGPRYRYRRQTYSAEYSTPLLGGLHRLTLQLKYRPQRYEARFVDDEEDEGLRRDARWIVSAASALSLGRRLELLPAYKFESRTSNDPEEKYRTHIVYLGLRYWFGGQGSPRVARRREAKKKELAGVESVLEPETQRREGSTPAPAPAAAAAYPDASRLRVAPGLLPAASVAAVPPRRERTVEPGGSLRFLRGTVRGCAGGRMFPLGRARVRLIGSSSSHTVETFATGEFEFDAVPAGSYELRIEPAGGAPAPRAFRSRIDLSRSISGYVAMLDCAAKASPLESE